METMASIIPNTAIPMPSATGPALLSSTTAATAKSKSKAKTVTKASGAAGTQAKAKKPSRKKTTTNTTTTTTLKATTSSTAVSQTILNNAKAAQADLERQQAEDEARRMDPLWYRLEDIMPISGCGGSDSTLYSGIASTVLPEQAQVVEQVLATYGLGPSDVTPQAMTCLLEQSRRFANEIISNAQDLAFSANRSEVLDNDLQLAAKMRADFREAVSAQIPKLNQMAQHVNREPLPPIPSHCYSGVLLPPKHHQLTARTYDVVSGARVQRKMIHKVPQAPKKKKGVAAAQPLYGASKGRPIAVKLKTTESSATEMELSHENSASQGMSSSASPPATTEQDTTMMDVNGPQQAASIEPSFMEASECSSEEQKESSSAIVPETGVPHVDFHS